MRLTRGRRIPTYRRIYLWLDHIGFGQARKGETMGEFLDRFDRAIVKLKRWK